MPVLALSGATSARFLAACSVRPRPLSRVLQPPRRHPALGELGVADESSAHLGDDAPDVPRSLGVAPLVRHIALVGVAGLATGFVWRARAVGC